MDSTGALALVDIPKSMLVIGGGYIGLEMGTVYANLGTEVSVVEFADGLVPMADRDLIKPLRKKLDELFNERIYTNTKVGSLTVIDDQVEVTFEGPALHDTRRYDRVLVSVGRRPNSQNLGLENTQVKVTDRGFVVCDARQLTADSNIYAIGDLAGDPMLAHKATHEAKVAVANIAGHEEVWDHKCIPAVMFTNPEIAWAGLTENEAETNSVAYEVASYPWAASGRAQALGRTEGLTKLLIDPATNRVLGCGMVGPGAGELIAEVVLAIEMGCEVEDLTESIHPHPTLSETVMNAGELYYGTAVEMYKPRKK
jgi:dihydrolipoamide dehydrogenase